MGVPARDELSSDVSVYSVPRRLNGLQEDDLRLALILRNIVPRSPLCLLRGSFLRRGRRLRPGTAFTDRSLVAGVTSSEVEEIVVDISHGAGFRRIGRTRDEGDRAATSLYVPLSVERSLTRGRDWMSKTRCGDGGDDEAIGNNVSSERKASRTGQSPASKEKCRLARSRFVQSLCKEIMKTASAKPFSVSLSADRKTHFRPVQRQGSPASSKIPKIGPLATTSTTRY